MPLSICPKIGVGGWVVVVVVSTVDSGGSVPGGLVSGGAVSGGAAGLRNPSGAGVDTSGGTVSGTSYPMISYRHSLPGRYNRAGPRAGASGRSQSAKSNCSVAQRKALA